MADLKPCPFCGAEPEVDMNQGYRALVSGKIGTSVAIYCTECEAHMSLCREDVPILTSDDMLRILTENWNKRTV